MNNQELTLELGEEAGAHAGTEELVDQLLDLTESAADDVERRRTGPRGRSSSPRLLIYRLVNGLVDRVQASRLGTIFLVLVVAVSAVVIWYSLTQRGALITQGHEVTTQRQQLASQLDELRQAVEQRDLGTVMANVSQAETTVFADYQQLARWLADQHEYAQRLSLNFRYTLADPSPSKVKNMLEVPIAMQVAVTRETAGLEYQRVLEFMKNVIDAPWHVEIVSAALTGEAVGVNEMQANLKVWVNDTAELGHEEDSE